MRCYTESEAFLAIFAVKERFRTPRKPRRQRIRLHGFTDSEPYTLTALSSIWNSSHPSPAYCIFEVSSRGTSQKCLALPLQ